MKNLAAAMCKVMAEASHVQKTGKNSFHGYNYASDEDLLRVLQPAMVKAGLAMFPSGITQTDRQLDKGKTCTDVHVEYTIIHSSGESITIQAVGRGIDKEDKGPYKAMTGALKYALRQTFLVPTGDDPEVHSSAHEEPQSESKPQPKPQQRQKPSAPSKPRQATRGAPAAAATPSCPKCGGEMWDDSEKRRAGGKAPAYKCKEGRYNPKTKSTDGCNGVIWDVLDSEPKNQKASEMFDDEEIPF